jgi:prepilin-type N-terminal cleavage/methylation domain-containing protein/prepilin-type processing-associated H-X9-DG protein
MKVVCERLTEKSAGKGFTLVELLVVIAIIAMLLAILMPSLSKAKNSAYAVKCGANLKNIGYAMQSQVADTGYYPQSYAYPKDDKGTYDLKAQPEDHPNGYVHWSFYLFDKGRCDASAFSCPGSKDGGAPRTNPGLVAGDWGKGQQDQNGSTSPNSLTDKQAPRMAYTANAAIIGRNKFKPGFETLQRHNRLVKANEVETPSKVILVTEFNKNWNSLIGENVVKSHRPIMPFSHTATGYAKDAVYQAGMSEMAYEYGEGLKSENYGLKNLAAIDNPDNHYLDGDNGHQLNAVGRHHPGGDDWKDKDGNPMGGTTNFLYCDGHVERKTLQVTLDEKEWGNKLYSLDGRTMVRY